MTMTNAAVAALAHAPTLADDWLPRDPHAPIRFRRSGRFGEKAGVTHRHGHDREAGRQRRRRQHHAAAEDAGDGIWRITGHKWFLSAPMSDAFLVLAQTVEGLSCFLVPRFLPDGSRNGIRLMRLKDKLGNRSNATAEVEFDDAAGWLVGEPGRGVADDHRHGDADPARLRRRLGRPDADRARRGGRTTPATARPSARCSSTSR